MENSGWEDILNYCNEVVSPQDFGGAEQFMDLSWQGQGLERSLNASINSVRLNNLEDFGNRAQKMFGSAVQSSYGSHEENIIGGGGGFLEYGQVLQEENAETCTASLTRTNIPSQIMLESCEVLPLKTSRRTHFQRANHILAERQRREEMNEKFSVLRSFIPKPIKKDKASIIAETIDYVIDMESSLKKLRACKAERQASPPAAKPRMSGDTDAIQKLNITNCKPNVDAFEEPKMTRAQWKTGQVEIQELDVRHALIKINNKRKRGLAMQIHVSLEECKVDVLQSSVTTVGDNIVQFTTIQMNPDVSANMNRVVDAIEQASTSLP